MNNMTFSQTSVQYKLKYVKLTKYSLAGKECYKINYFQQIM